MKQTIKKKRLPILDTGFSNRAENEGERLLNKDGTFNVNKRGLVFLERFSVFHWLINMSWIRFLLVMFAGYILINLLFASVYLLGGIDGLSGDHPEAKMDQFLQAFYFSSQTLTTVGFGQLSPIKTFHSMMAAFESFIGLMSFAMATGLLYGKFSRPRSGIVFSKNALISPYKKDGKGLMIRLANAKNNQLINVSAVMIISWVDKSLQGVSRKYYFLPLEMEEINMLATSWTVVHPIDEDSPLFSLSHQDLLDKKAEVILQLKGYDESYSHEIHAMTSYKGKEIISNAKFKRILVHDGEFLTLNLDELGAFDSVEDSEIYKTEKE